MPDEKLPLILPPGSGLAISGPQGGRIVTEMVGGALELSRAREALIPRFRIGDHDLCEPDYQQIVLWAKTLKLNPETVIERILTTPDREWEREYRSQFLCGRIVQLYWDNSLLPLESFEWVAGLVIESMTITLSRKHNSPIERRLKLPLPRLRRLDCQELGLVSLDLTTVPYLEKLVCGCNLICELDLSAVPFLKELSCTLNKLTRLDLSGVPQLTSLWCSDNRLTSLDLSTVANLTELMCWHNELSTLDVSPVTLLKELCCDFNRLHELDVSSLSFLTQLWCRRNALASLDIRSLHRLVDLRYDEHTTRLIKRPDQNF